MIVIGIDPGTRITGFGIVEVLNNQYQVLDYGVICPPVKAPLEKRYLAIHTALRHLLQTFKPQHLAIETQFVDKNVQSAIKLGMARGVCILAAAQEQIDVHEYTPTTTKKAVVGKGHASKRQVQKMIQLLLGMEKEVCEDTADALAIAICHHHALKFKASLTLQI